MGTESAELLAIRTIAVSARAAINSSHKLGRPDIAAESARRGLVMLDGLRDRLGADPPERIRQAFGAAVRELRSTADAPAANGEDGLATELRSGRRPSRGTS